jgi:2-dehydro-3-deoxygluconokinase
VSVQETEPSQVDLATVGESMALLVPEVAGRLRHVPSLLLKVGGAESNAAIAAARLGLSSRWVGRLGDDELGQLVRGAVAAEGVDARVVWASGERTGLYLRDQIPGAVRAHYYREGSAASGLKPGGVDARLLTRAAVLHLTGVTPALSEECADFVRWAVEEARAAGTVISLDVNYREKLWSAGRARGFLTEIAGQVDLLFVSGEEASALWDSEEPAVLAEALGLLPATELLVKHGPGGATYWRDGERIHLAGFPVARVVDPIGAGDAFAAGYLAAYRWGEPVEERLRVANAMGAWCVMSSGDYEGLPQRRELDAYLNGDKELGR